MKRDLSIILVLIFIIVVTSVVILLVFCIGNNTKINEEVLTKDMKSYYEKYLKDKVFGITRYQVSLEMLSKTGYDMSKYSRCNLKRSFSYIEIEGNKITVENHLNCSI